VTTLRSPTASAADELVVVDGADGLRDGVKVAVQPGRGTRTAKTLMNPSRPFILRPVATTLLMTAILLRWHRRLPQLPVSALPQVDYPTIQVLTFFPGASPDVMASAVTAPLERQFGQMPGLNQMTSRSSTTSSVITCSSTWTSTSTSPSKRCRRRSTPRPRFCRTTSRTAHLQQGEPGRHADP